MKLARSDIHEGDVYTKQGDYAKKDGVSPRIKVTGVSDRRVQYRYINSDGSNADAPKVDAPIDSFRYEFKK